MPEANGRDAAPHKVRTWLVCAISAARGMVTAGLRPHRACERTVASVRDMAQELTPVVRGVNLTSKPCPGIFAALREMLQNLATFGPTRSQVAKGRNATASRGAARHGSFRTLGDASAIGA